MHGMSAHPEGTLLNRCLLAIALDLGNYAHYIKTQVNPICSHFPLNHTPFAGDYCFGTQNETYWADIRNSATRSYLYSTCTEGGLYQVAPKHGPSLISNVLDVNCK